MTATHPDQAKFEAAIRDEPACDAHRLVYADWLSEHADDGVVCQKCSGKGRIYTGMDGMKWVPCNECHGSGTVPNGFAARAEFIRLQCRIATLQRDCSCGACVKLRGGGQHHNGPCAVDRERDELPDGSSRQAFLRKRERELFGDHSDQWFDIIRRRVSHDNLMCEMRTGEGHVYTVRRGFVAEVRCPLAAWMDAVCVRCEGECRIRVPRGEPSQGFDWNPCRDCHGSGRTGGIAAAVCGAHPVTAVRLVGKEPAQIADPPGKDFFTWFEGNVLSETSPHHLPSDLFRLLDRRRFDTAALAHAALSAAALAYGKGKVK